MTPSTRKKVLIGAVGVLVVLVAALLIAPAFFDLNKYKPEIAAEVRKATGRELVIAGSASLSLLPTPVVSVSGVKFLNERGARNPTMVEVKSVTVKPSLLALLTGRIEIAEVTLLEPKIVLEINAEGKPNWEFAPSVAEAKPAAPKPSSPRPLSVGRLTIDDGTLIFSDAKQGVSVTADKANFTASVGSLDGPYALAGGASVNGAPLKIDLSLGAKGSGGLATSLMLEAGGGKLSFNGKVSELGPNARLAGIASVSADSLTAFVGTLANLAGQAAPPLPPLLAGKFSFDGGVEASQKQFAARDFKLALAGDSGSGSITVTLKPALAVEGKLSLPKIDLDRTLSALSTAAPAAAPGKPASPAAQTPGSGASILDSVSARLSIDAAEVVYNKQPVRNVALEIDAKGGAVAVPKLNATLPGDMVLQARSTMSGDPARPTVSGDFSLVGPKLRDTLNWLAVDVSSVPAGKLQRLSLKGKLGSSGGSVQVSDAVFELDDVKGSGGVTVTFSVPLSIVTRLDLDTIDLDSFLAKPADGQKKAAPAPAPSSGRPAPAGPTVGLKLKVAKAIYNRETIGGIDVDLALQGSALKFNDVKVANLGGARLAVRGAVANYEAALPRFDIAFNFEAPDISRALKVAGATAPAGLGHVTASGGVSGTVEALTFKELDIGADGQKVRIDGTLTMPGAARGQASSIGYKGRVTTNGQTIEGTVDAKVADRPNITADLKTTLLDLDKLRSVAPAAPAPRGVGRPTGQPATPAASSSSTDLAGLRAFDASLKLVAGTLVSSPLRISNADIAVTLKNGVLTLQHLKGGIYGGTLDLSGTINAAQPALAFDFKGDANGINLGEMLRSTSGTNVFGGSVKITVDGRINANAITVRGQGATSDQIRASMVGGAQLGGHVFVGADKALIGLGSVAAGAAGGVIDNTLGNVLGVVGQRNIASNLLTAASVLLNRFVNRDNPISGHVDIAGGVLSDKSLIVSGDRATANIVTRTNLVNSTTDTTVNCMIAEDGSAPYLIATVRGPLSSPSYGVTRGSAKDPPGVVNTLTNTVPSIIPGIGGGSSGGGSQGGSGSGGGQRPIINIPIPNIFGR